MKDTSAVISSDSCHKSKDQKHVPSDDETRDNAKEYLRSMLNKLMRIRLSDGRILIGVFLCTDRDSNVILTWRIYTLTTTEKYPTFLNTCEYPPVLSKHCPE